MDIHSISEERIVLNKIHYIAIGALNDIDERVNRIHGDVGTWGNLNFWESNPEGKELRRTLKKIITMLETMRDI